MLTETISAMHLLVLPLSSLIVIGRSSLILSKAAAQLSCTAKKEAFALVQFSIQNPKRVSR